MAKRKTLAKKGRKDRKTKKSIKKVGGLWYTQKKSNSHVDPISDKDSEIRDIESQIKGTQSFCIGGGARKDLEMRKRHIKNMINTAFQKGYINDDEADTYDKRVDELKCE